MLFVRITPGVSPMDRHHLEHRAIEVVPATANPRVTGGGTMMSAPFTADFEISLTLNDDDFPTVIDAVKAAVLAEVPAGTEVTVERESTRFPRSLMSQSRRRAGRRSQRK